MANLTKLIEDCARLEPDFPEYSPSETARVLAKYENTPFEAFTASEIEEELVTNFKHLFIGNYAKWLKIPSWGAAAWARGERDSVLAHACDVLAADSHETPWIEEYLTRYFEEHKDEE